MRRSAVCLILGALSFLPVHAQDAAQAPATKISHFSGKPVPRFESLKFSAVHGRIGPSLDHPIAWKYERKSLPVLVLKESRDWRFVRDPAGDEVWVHARMLTSARTVIMRQETELKRKPDADADPSAVVQRGVVAELSSCADQWCEIKAGSQTGYVQQSAIWGSEAREAGL